MRQDVRQTCVTSAPRLESQTNRASTYSHHSYDNGRANVTPKRTPTRAHLNANIANACVRALEGGRAGGVGVSCALRRIRAAASAA